MEFVSWSKIPRLNREWEITEKIDGTNGVLLWLEPLYDNEKAYALAQVDGLALYAGSRNRWLTPESDNFGFAKWAKENAEDLRSLGQGRHYGEWYGLGINRGYGLNEKRFALFNTKLLEAWWGSPDLVSELPQYVDVVPVLSTVMGQFLNTEVQDAIRYLKDNGSAIAYGFDRPEGVVVRHIQHGDRFKVLCEGDEAPKGVVEDA